MTAGQFAALARLLRLRKGKAQAVARRVLVDGEATPQAARSEGLEYRTAHSAVKRARIGFALAQRVTTPENQ